MIQNPAARMLTAAADHIQRVGIYQGDGHLWQPEQMGDVAPCTPLHAFETGVRAVRPNRFNPEPDVWDAFQAAIVRALTTVSDHVNGTPIRPERWEQLQMSEYGIRRSVLWLWGDEPGRTTEDTAAAFREAAELAKCDVHHVEATVLRTKNLV